MLIVSLFPFKHQQKVFQPLLKMQSNSHTIANALDYIKCVCCTNLSAALRMHPTVTGGVAVQVDGVDLTHIFWAVQLPEKECSVHCEMDACLIEEHNDEQVHHGNRLAVNGETPCTFRFVLHWLGHHLIDGVSQCKKLPDCVEAFIKDKCPNLNPSEAHAGHCEDDKKDAVSEWNGLDLKKLHTIGGTF